LAAAVRATATERLESDVNAQRLTKSRLFILIFILFFSFDLMFQGFEFQSL
jgi:hypothetical protein